MAESNDRLKNSAALYQQYEEALFRIALMELMQEEMEALESADGAYEPDEQAQGRVLRAIDRAVGRRQTTQFVHRTLPKLVTYAACLVLVCFVGLTTAIATSDTVREQVLGLLIVVGEGQTQLSLAPVDKEEQADVPQAFTEAYYPGYIPHGYELEDVYGGDSATYRHRRSDQYLWFSVNDENTGVGISSENAKIRYLTIHGSKAILSVEPTNSFISWALGDKFFIIQVDNDDEQMLIRIADSVHSVEQEG